MLGRVFLSLLKFFEKLVSVSAIDRTSVAIERTFAFRCIVCALALDRLNVRASAYQTRPTLECSLWTLVCNALVRSSALASCFTFARLCSVPTLEHISAVSTNKREAAIYSFFIIFFYCYLSLFVYVSTCLLFHLSVVFNFY